MNEMRLFVCGAFCEGMILFRKFKELVRSVEDGEVVASAWRLPIGYPVLIKDGQDSIRGQVLTLQATDMTVRFFDALFSFDSLRPKSSLHFRENVIVQTSRGPEQVQCYFYNSNLLPKGSTPIPLGDWHRSLRDKPPLIDQLTERQAEYVRKLGAASGREIVPINDISLYRELMNLELIVDKGRRLALSKLGKEVYSYLV
ncbi:MAG: gamma-glutamylcyclotransferase [Bdellovibrionaceae bacterium]|nr:gamma-glutamylcyclotransferase [Pseudobdellovibrionaceae bacterium]